MVIYPWEYTYKEGGNFTIWTKGSVTYHQLKKLVGGIQGPKTVEINTVIVHSLIFESASAGYGNYARWDCINGWTTTISQARKHFSWGCHGESNKFNRGSQSWICKEGYYA